MALGNMKSHAKQFVEPKIQITSMMDMFTIILIFLLFSFSDNPETLTLDNSLKLPESNAQLDYKENIKLVLSQTELKLEGEVISDVQDGKIMALDPENLKESSLFSKLKELKENEAQTELNPDKKKNILFLCDKRLEFKTINTLVKTAAMAGYPNFQFGVLQKN